MASIYIIYSWALICKAQVLVHYNLNTLTIPCTRLRPFATAERMGTKHTNISMHDMMGMLPATKKKPIHSKSDMAGRR